MDSFGDAFLPLIPIFLTSPLLLPHLHTLPPSSTLSELRNSLVQIVPDASWHLQPSYQLCISADWSTLLLVPGLSHLPLPVKNRKCRQSHTESNTLKLYSNPLDSVYLSSHTLTLFLRDTKRHHRHQGTWAVSFAV